MILRKGSKSSPDYFLIDVALASVWAWEELCLVDFSFGYDGNLKNRIEKLPRLFCIHFLFSPISMRISSPDRSREEGEKARARR